MKPSRSFTARAKGRLRVLATECSVAPAFDPHDLGGKQPPNYLGFRGIWDTGASGSVVTQAVVDACGLQPTGMMQTYHAQGEEVVPTFLVNIGLPNQVAFKYVQVTLGRLAGFDVLIGMDIIGQGDFAITCEHGDTVFTFRMPSCATLDFVKETEKENRLAPAPKVPPGPRPKKPGKSFGKNKHRHK